MKAGIAKADDVERAAVLQLIQAIRMLKADSPVKRPGIWYVTQKQHWLGWLAEYNTRGAYGRIPGKNRDARFAYNHVVEPLMLVWLISAAGVPRKLVREAKDDAARRKTMMAQSAAIRRRVPWEVVAGRLWLSEKKQKASRADAPRLRRLALGAGAPSEWFGEGLNDF